MNNIARCWMYNENAKVWYRFILGIYADCIHVSFNNDAWLVKVVNADLHKCEAIEDAAIGEFSLVEEAKKMADEFLTKNGWKLLNEEHELLR